MRLLPSNFSCGIKAGFSFGVLFPDTKATLSAHIETVLIIVEVISLFSLMDFVSSNSSTESTFLCLITMTQTGITHPTAQQMF